MRLDLGHLAQEKIYHVQYNCSFVLNKENYTKFMD